MNLRNTALALFGASLACAGPADVDVPTSDVPTGAAEPEAAAVPAPAPELAPRVVPRELTYRRTGETAETTAWSERQLVALGVDLANLRAAPDAEAPVVTTVPLGAEVTVLEPSSEQTELLERTNRWYRVRIGAHEGHLFGSLLTPVVSRADLDGDGADEVVAVTFGPAFTPRVRVLEPGLHEEADRVAALDVTFPGLADGGTVTAEVVTAPHDPWKLLWLRLCAGERCVERLVSYLREDGRPLGVLRELPGDPAALGFVAGGLRFGSGPVLRPVRGAFTAEACPDCAALVSFTPATSESLVDVVLQSFDRGPDTVLDCDTFGTVAEGRYRGKALVSCVVVHNGRSDYSNDPDVADLVRFVRRSDTAWTLLRRATHYASSYWGTEEMAIQRLSAQGIAVEVDTDTVVHGLTGPEVLREWPWGQLRLRYAAPPAWTPGAIEPALTDPVAGAVYTELGDVDNGAFLVPQPDGAHLVYSYELRDLGDVTLVGGEDPRGGATYQPFLADCGERSLGWVDLVSVGDADLRAFATTASGLTLWVLPDPEHELNRGMYVRTGGPPVYGREDLAPDARPVPQFFWKDPFGRVVRMFRSDRTDPDCEW